MKITVNLTGVTNEQLKFLSQLGMFHDDKIWESDCEPEDFNEVNDLLKQAGVKAQVAPSAAVESGG